MLRLDVSLVGFLFSGTLEQTRSFGIYGNIVEVIQKGSDAREKERNDPRWHFESFSFLKPKFAFEGAMKRERASARESPHLSSATCYRVT